MGHLLEYSGIVTKTRAMESRLLSPGQFQELASLHTIPEAVEYLKKEQVEAIAVCYINSYANEGHERKTVEKIKELFNICC